MSEITHGMEAHEPTLNRIVIIDALNEIGIVVDLKDWLEYDDQEVLSQLAQYARLLKVGIDDLYELCHIEIANAGGNHEV